MKFSFKQQNIFSYRGIVCLAIIMCIDGRQKLLACDDLFVKTILLSNWDDVK